MIISHIYTNFCWYVKYLPVFFGHCCQLPDLYIMIPLDHKEGWAPNNCCFSLVMLEKTLESPLDGKEIKPVNLKENQSWIFIERTDAEAEDPIFCPFDVKSWLTGNDRDAGKDWEQEEKRVTEDEMVGWHHRLNGHEFEQLWEMVKDREAWCDAIHGLQKVWHDFSTVQQNPLEIEVGAESAEWPVQHSIAYKWWSQITVFPSENFYQRNSSHLVLTTYVEVTWISGYLDLLY